MKIALTYVSTAVMFFVVDMLWLGTLATSFYRARIPDVLATDVNYTPAALFYFLYVGGIVYFAVWPALAQDSWKYALVNGAIFGFMCYATYDLTNQATMKQWSTAVTVVDIAWGTFASGATATLSFFLSRWAHGWFAQS